MKIKYFFLTFIILSFLQSKLVSASIENLIVANVGNKIISSYELKNKIKTILFLSKQQLNQENINSTKTQALRSLIDLKIKKQEIEKYEVDVSKSKNLDMFLKNTALRFNTDIPGLKKVFVNENIDFEIYKEELRLEFAWQQLIFNLYKNKVTLNENEINNELEEIVKTQQDIKEYLLAEIEIPFSNNLNDQKNIDNVLNEIDQNGFKDAAIKYSIGATAFDGGNLGWINSKSLAENILKIVSGMKVGEISKPIKQTNSFIMLKLIEERKVTVDKLNLEELRARIINSKKNEVLDLYSNNHLSKLKSNSLIKIK